MATADATIAFSGPVQDPTAVTFLRALRHPLTAPFWDALARDHHHAPPALQELARGDNSVVCDRDGAHASLEWARRHWAWTESPEAVWIETT